MQVRALTPTDAEQYQALRLLGLKEVPSAFASSFEEEAPTPIDEIATRLHSKEDGAIFGSFEEGILIGCIGIQRENMAKLSHKAFIWGMYIFPECRGRGQAKILLDHALQFAVHSLHVMQVNLGVHTQNAGAIALYRNAGFEVWATERQALIVNGQPQDEHHMVYYAPRPA
jgi:RimJ/RimL family protein N-acetyltransferase